jgi:osmotically-inducible protein OsmY
VVISNYFLRPGLESSIKDQVQGNLSEGGIKTVKVSVEGRNVLLEGFTLNHSDWMKAESIVNKIQGINQVENLLVVKNQTTE